ncbi:MT-A70 family methyltransferase [Rhodopseudomonas palustris]|uniref:MT-A70 family methyltransferase n=1 Tax=Rhodopseudomonas palustris TaxID=1076 RepID=UPI0006427C3D|nr:MT-A70 family methyltransferase [Rhodopseudomonas palustris]
MRFPLIYADPAWTFETYSEEGKEHSPEQHYECMSLDEIMNLPVADIAAEDSGCLMWVTDPLLDKGLETMKRWGFTFKTIGLYYVKVGRGLRPHVGMGYWTRANPEICIFGTRGRPKRKGKDVERLILDLDPDERVILAPRGEHSQKPLEAYNRIERLIDGPYLEMFARHARHGWHHWGNEVGKTGGVPNLFHLPGYPATASNDNSLFGGTNAA